MEQTPTRGATSKIATPRDGGEGRGQCERHWVGRDSGQQRQPHLGGPLCGAARAAPFLHPAGQAGREAGRGGSTAGVPQGDRAHRGAGQAWALADDWVMCTSLTRNLF